MLDVDQIDWKDLIDEGIQAIGPIAEQKIRQKRSKARNEAFGTETDFVASQIRKRQLETSQSEQKAERKIWYDNEEKTTSPASSHYFTDKRTDDSDLVEELPKNTSVRGLNTEDNEAVEVIYDESSLWLSGGSSSMPEISTEPSLPSMKYTKKFFWSLSLCEMGIIFTDKVEMNTTIYTIKTIFVKACSEIKTGNIKNTNLNLRLRLSCLFSSVGYKPQPISVGYVAEQAIFSPFTTQNINTPAE